MIFFLEVENLLSVSACSKLILMCESGIEKSRIKNDYSLVPRASLGLGKRLRMPYRYTALQYYVVTHGRFNGTCAYYLVPLSTIRVKSMINLAFELPVATCKRKLEDWDVSDIQETGNANVHFVVSQVSPVKRKSRILIQE